MNLLFTLNHALSTPADFAGAPTVSDWIYALILGLVEGLTEFIPVSSTGMMLLTKEVLNLPGQFWDTFCVLIQLGAILAVVVLYFRQLWRIALLIPTQPRARGS